MRQLIESIKGSPMGQFVGLIGDGLPGGAVKMVGDRIQVTGSDKDEVVGAISSAMSAIKKKVPDMPTAFGWQHKAGDGSYTVILSPRFD